ncbi:MAG: hypothetical protein KAJ81_10785, partial [Candidatus Latescibacteria bacterium]|nr:hypothetical protein [Candidatus Latescibacterota bacterium]
DPARFAQIAERHLRAFRWEKQDRIPLGLIVNDPKYSQGITLDQWLNPEVFLRLQASNLRDTLEVGSDVMPSIALNHMGNALIPSAFGAKITIPGDRVTSIQDSGPWISPVLRDIRETDDLSFSPIPSGLVCEAERFMRCCRHHLPEWVRVVSPAKLGPFSLAELLRGSAFYLDLAVDPDRCRRLLDLCTSGLIAVEQYLRNGTGPSSDEHYSEFGIRGPGIRIGEDSLINVSQAMIREFALPRIDRMAQAFGGRIYVHFCTLEKSRSEHVYEALAQASCVFAASSQFGFAYYEKNVDQLEGRLAIESLYGDGIDYLISKHGSFEDWAREFVPRFKDRSGLILYFEVQSVEE